MAKVTVEFKGAKDGEIYPTEFKVGDELEGELAAAMVAAGYAVDEEKKLDRPANKALKGAPENK